MGWSADFTKILQYYKILHKTYITYCNSISKYWPYWGVSRGPKFVICDIIYVPPLQTTFSRTIWPFRHISFPHKTAPSRATKPLFKELVIIFPFAGSVEQLWWAWHYERSRFMLRWILFTLHLPHSSGLISQNQAHALFRQLQAQF